MIKVLIACEFTGVVRDAFIRQGADAYSCDLRDTIIPGPHYKCDVLDILDNGWDLMIAHPPCTYLATSGISWTLRGLRPRSKTDEALTFVRKLLRAPIRHICIENPVGLISTHIRQPTQYIQPYDFGHDASKRTGLWLKNLPILESTKRIQPVWVGGYTRWANQTDDCHDTLTPGPAREMLRSITYIGVADAMADQWVKHIKEVKSCC